MCHEVVLVVKKISYQTRDGTNQELYMGRRKSHYSSLIFIFLSSCGSEQELGVCSRIHKSILKCLSESNAGGYTVTENFEGVVVRGNDCKEDSERLASCLESSTCSQNDYSLYRSCADEFTATKGSCPALWPQE
jgi:hypothetical protein